MPNKINPEISVAVPLYNEEKNVGELYRRLIDVLKSTGKTYEIVFVNDGSRDRTADELKKINSHDKQVKVIFLSRNFGHEAAVTAALDHTNGEIVVLMDGDLQDAPEFIPEMLKKLSDGYDVVYAQHNKRNDPTLRKILFKSFYAVMDKLSSYKLPTEAGAFSVMRRPVVDVLSSMTERNRYVAGLRSWVGFKQAAIDYEKQPRFAGVAPQTFSKLLKMGMDGLFSFSYVPLRMATYLGMLVSLGAFLAILDVLYQKLVAGTAILGWSSPLVATLFIGGVQLIILGIVGEYLGRIYDEVKRRPYYVVSEKIGF